MSSAVALVLLPLDALSVTLYASASVRIVSFTPINCIPAEWDTTPIAQLPKLAFRNPAELTAQRRKKLCHQLGHQGDNLKVWSFDTSMNPSVVRENSWRQNNPYGYFSSTRTCSSEIDVLLYGLTRMSQRPLALTVGATLNTSHDLSLRTLFGTEEGCNAMSRRPRLVSNPEMSPHQYSCTLLFSAF